MLFYCIIKENLGNKYQSSLNEIFNDIQVQNNYTFVFSTLKKDNLYDENNLNDCLLSKILILRVEI